MPVRLGEPSRGHASAAQLLPAAVDVSSVASLSGFFFLRKESSGSQVIISLFLSSFVVGGGASQQGIGKLVPDYGELLSSMCICFLTVR